MLGALGDADFGTDVDVYDSTQFVDCVSGPGLPADEQACGCVGFDGDADVDLRDWGALQVSFPH